MTLAIVSEVALPSVLCSLLLNKQNSRYVALVYYDLRSQFAHMRRYSLNNGKRENFSATSTQEDSISDNENDHKWRRILCDEPGESNKTPKNSRKFRCGFPHQPELIFTVGALQLGIL